MEEQKTDILTRTAAERFGLTYLFPYQRLVITNILRKAGLFSREEAEEAPPNQVVLLPTGAGKSLCFMLPAALLPGLTIVVFPLLGLMADQLRRVEEAGMKGAMLKGGIEPQREGGYMALSTGRRDPDASDQPGDADPARSSGQTERCENLPSGHRRSSYHPRMG